MRQFTPENITELKPNEVFVFGSNMAGNHAGGAARTAVEKFGAVMGQAEGLQGQSYAIPTLDKDMNKVTPEQLQASLERLAEYARVNSSTTFYLTKIGCGIAGFTEEEVIRLLNNVDMPGNIVIPEDFNVVYAFKAFDKEMKCYGGYQYEIGKEYETNQAKACHFGFHACRNPWDVMKFYPLVDENGDMSRYATVEQGGYIDRSESDKTCSTKIKIKAELGFPGFIRACVEWVKEKTAPKKVDVDVVDSGDYAKIGNSGYYAQIGNSGDGAKIGNSGNYAKIGNSGDYAKIGSSGDDAQIGNSGDGAKIGNSGSYAKIGNSGDDAKIGSSGYGAKIGNSGDDAQIGSSGNYAKIGNSGNYAKIGSSGNYAQIESTGEDCVIVNAGHNCRAKAKKGSWITLSEWILSEEKGRWVPLFVRTEQVDGETIKADTWYILKGGKFVECDER